MTAKAVMRINPFSVIAGVVVLTAGMTTLVTAAAQAEPMGMAGNYVGVNFDLNANQDWIKQVDYRAGWFVDRAIDVYKVAVPPDQVSPAATDAKTFQARLDFKDTPISLRGKAAVSPEATVIQPFISYDVAIARNMNLYAGAGYSFTTSNRGKPATNERDAVMLVTGAEAAISPAIVVYGDAQFRLNQPGGPTTPAKIQFGAGLRF